MKINIEIQKKHLIQVLLYLYIEKNYFTVIFFVLIRVSISFCAC